MGQAKIRKAEINAIKSRAMTAVDFIETIKALVTEEYGWKDTYVGNLSDSQNTVLSLTIKQLAKNHKITRVMIQDAYPDEGTYTFTDGVVDLALGAMHPKRDVLLSLFKAGIPFAFAE